MDAAIARPRRRAQAVTSEESWKQKVSISEQFRFRRGSSMTSRGSPSRFLTAVLHNGVGRYVRQLQRLQLLFSPTAADSRGARQFVEEAAMDFARRHPDVVLYVSPRSGGAPVLLAEYLNGTVREELIASKTSEEIVQLATKLAGQSGLDIIRIRKPFHTDNPSIQGQWHPLTNKPSALNVQGPRLQPK